MALAHSFCPYVGLQPYTEQEREFFFGRDRDKRVISSNLFAASVTVLYGASGVGKSSVLMAGVVPMLREKLRTVVVFRDWQRPDFMSALKHECLKQAAQGVKNPVAISADLPLDELLFNLGQAFGGTVLLLLDQFEEYFLYHPESEAGNDFDTEFARTVNRDDIDANFLLAVREDGLAKLDRFRARIPNLMGNLLRLRHLNAVSAEEAIRKPLASYNERLGTGEEPVSIEDGLVSAIICQVRSGYVSLAPSTGAGKPQEREDEVRIETPFLQLVLTRLWEEELGKGSRTLRLETLNRLGGAQEIVRTHLDDVMNKLEPLEQKLCASFFDRLVTPSGTKIACRLDDLGKWAEASGDEVLHVVTVLSESRVLRAISAAPGQPGSPPSFEVFHDVLAPAVLDWRRRYAEQQAVEEIRKEEEDKRDQERLRMDRELALAKSRRMARFTMASLGVAVVLAGSTFFAFQQRRVAVESQKLAQERLYKIKDSIKLIKAALSDEPLSHLDKLAQTNPDLFNKEIKFTVTYKSLHQKNPDNNEVYRFKIFPDFSLTPDQKKSISSITYRMPHATFKVQLVQTGPENNFMISYVGWGTIKVIAIIEYTDPEEAPTIAIIDMARLQRPE